MTKLLIYVTLYKKMNKLSKLLLVLSLSFVILTPQIVTAHQENNPSRGRVLSEVEEPEDEDDIEDRREHLKERAEQRLKERKERQASKAAERKEKLDEKRQKVCEKRSDKIIKRSNQLAQRAEKQLNKFTEIAGRVDNFYLNRLVPKGVTLANYDALKADIEARKQEVADTVASAKTAAASFDCSGEDPKGQLGSYRDEMKVAVAALKDFRISIKNFIVAVRTAAAKANSATSSAESGE